MHSIPCDSQGAERFQKTALQLTYETAAHSARDYENCGVNGPFDVLLVLNSPRGPLEVQGKNL